MRNVLRKLTAAVGGGLFLLAALVGSFPAFALTVPPTFAPRDFNTQQTHYLRFTFNFNSCVQVTFTGSGVNQRSFCSVKVGALPYNAYLVRAFQSVTTAFNSSTSDSISIGTSAVTSGTLLVNNAQINSQSTTNGQGSLSIVTGSFGTQALGNTIAQTGADGGFDIWAQYEQHGTTATAGAVTLVLEYFAPNDGACVAVPLGSTSAAC